MRALRRAKEMSRSRAVGSQRGSLNAKLIGFLVAVVIALILIYNVTQSMAVGQLEGTAVRSMKTLKRALVTYASMWGGFPLSLSELSSGKVKLLDAQFAAGEEAGYVFTYTPSDRMEGSRIVTSYAVVGRPKDPAIHARNFFMDESGVIRESPAGVEPDAKSTPY
jgi:hypothetical protein